MAFPETISALTEAVVPLSALQLIAAIYGLYVFCGADGISPLVIVTISEGFTIGLASFNNNFLIYVSLAFFTILSAIVDYFFLAVFLSYGLKTHKVTSIAWGLLAYCFIMEYAAFNSLLLVDIFTEYNFIFLMVPILACLVIIPVMISKNKWKVPNDLSITVRKKATFEEHLVSLLTMNEKYVFELMCKGFSNKQLSEQLNITESTVKFHIRNILKKANARNRYDLLSMIHESDYITSK